MNLIDHCLPDSRTEVYLERSQIFVESLLAQAEGYFKSSSNFRIFGPFISLVA